MTVETAEEDGLSPFEKFSSFSKILRVLAYLQRWRLRANRLAPRTTVELSSAELSDARQTIFRLIQIRYFSTEISCVSAGKQVQRRSALARLSPFLDTHRLLRVGGRLHNAPLPQSERHPIILPGDCYFTKLLVRETHRLTLHGGIQLMKSHRRTCWIIGRNRLITSVYRKCTTCIRHGATPVQQQMAPLPAERLHPGRPFTTTGLDYAGPFPILLSKGRGAKTTKGYIAIFICCVVKAVHVEVVSDLTSEAFIAAFSRFTARRGLCGTILSDNGTTFKGADASSLPRGITLLERSFRSTSHARS